MATWSVPTEITFTHNVGVTIADIERRIKALSSTPVNIPVSFGKLGSPGSSSARSVDFSKPYEKANKEMKRLRLSINEIDSEMEKLGFQAALTAKRFLAFVGVSAVFIGLSKSISDGLTSAIAYEKQFAKISQVTGTSIRNLSELDREITRLSTTLGVGSDSISEIALTLAQAGLSARETTKALDVLAKTEIAATFGDIKNTTEGAIAIMAQFKTGAGDLAAQLSTVNTISAKFAVESEDLVEVVRKAGGAFQATGGSLNELFALFTSIRATTRESAESIATGLRTISTRLQRNRTVNFLTELGVNLRDAKGEFIGIYPAVEKLSSALKDISGTDPRFNQIVEELGGFRQVDKVIPLLKEFETSQKVLSAARRAGNSVDRDAVIAQKTLANQFVRVREEFLALSRSYYNDNGIRSTIALTLNLASALIKVADAVRPLVPLIGVIAAGQLITSTQSIIKGAIAQHSNTVGPRRKPFSSGGHVPGVGNGDTVPANLTPGEFVIRKSAARALGPAALHQMNRYASGGQVRKMLRGDILGAAGGLSDHGKLLRTVLNNKDLQSYIPKNSKYLTTGGEAIVLETPDKRVIRLGLHGRDSNEVHGTNNFGRPKDPLALQPLFARKFGNVQFELLPKVKIATGQHNLKEVEKFNQSLSSNPNLVGQDVKPDNLGYENGKLVAVDPGTFYDKSKIKRRRYASGGLVSSLKKRFNNFVGDGPRIQDQVKDLFSRGGLRRSLGISKANSFMGDAGFKSGSKVYPPILPEDVGPPQLNRKPSPVVSIKNVRKIFQEVQKDLGLSFDDSLVKKVIISNNARTARALGLSQDRTKTIKGAYSPRSRAILLNRGVIKDYDTLKSTLLHEFGHAVDDKLGGRTYSSLKSGTSARKLAILRGETDLGNDIKNNLTFSKEYSKYRYSPQEQFANVIRDSLLKKSYKNIPDEQVNRLLSLVGKKRYADGGGVGGQGNGDTVPALLTPGEFVINKRSAQAFGYQNLHKVNKYATGGRVAAGAGTALVGAQVGAQFLQGITGQNSSEGFKSFVNSLSLAAGALLVFTLGIKKDTSGFSDTIRLFQDDLNTNKKNLDSSAKEFSGRIRAKKEQNALLNAPLQEKVRQLSGFGPHTQRTLAAPGALKAQEDRQLKELTNARAKFKAERDLVKEENKRLATSIKFNQATEKAENEFNKLSDIVSYTSTALVLLGSLLGDANQRLADKGDRRGAFGFGTVNESAAAGTVTGAAIGGGAGLVAGRALGTVFGGPAGTVLGAKIGLAAGTAIGGVVGGISSGTSTADTIRNFEIRKSFEELERVLTNLGSGRTTAKGASFTVNQSSKKINEEFFKLSGDQFDTFRGAVENSIVGLETVFNENLKAATSVKDFTAENKELITVLTRFGGVSIPELEKRIANEVEARDKAVKAEVEITNVILENARRLEATFAITSALTSAENSVHVFGDALDKVSQLASGSFSDKSNFNFRGLSDISGTNSSDLTRQANQAAGFIGGPAQGIAKDVNDAGIQSQRLPSLLNDLVLRKQLDGDDLLDELKKQLGQGFSSGLILEAVKKEIGNTGDTTKFLQKFRQDPIGITKNIQGALQPLAQALADAAPRITQQFDEFADGLAAARENFLSALSGLTKSVDIAQVGREFNLASTGRPLSFAEGRGFDVQRQNLVTGGRDVGQLAGSLRQAQGNIIGLTQARQQTKDAGEFKRLTQAISDNIKEVQVSTRALDYLADVNNRLSTVEKERSRQQQIREAKTSLAKDFAFGDPAAQQEIVKGLVGVTQILTVLKDPNGGNPLGGLNNELKQKSLSILEQNSDNDIFNGFTGKEIINKILERQGFNVKPGQAETGAITDGNQLIAQAAAAREALNQSERDTNATFIKGLETKFDDFFTRLEKYFKDEKTKRDTDTNNEIDARKGGLDNQIGAINQAKAKVGLGANDPLDLINKNVDTALKIKGNRDDIGRANEALGKVIALTSKGQIPDVTGIIRNTLPAGDERNELEKKLFEAQNATSAFGNKLDAKSQNPIIEKLAREGLEKFTTRKLGDNKELTNQLGVDVGIRNQFIEGAKEAVEILKKANVVEDIPKLQQQKKDIEATRRSSGGSIFAKRGSDTVPAMSTDGSPYMLTPGEFVMNRRAVARLGLKTLTGLNSGYLSSGGIVKPKDIDSNELIKQAEKDRQDSIKRQKETSALSQSIFGTKKSNQAEIAANKAKLAAIQADKTPVTGVQDGINKFLDGRRVSDFEEAAVKSGSVHSSINKFDIFGNLKVKTNKTFTPDQLVENAKRVKRDAYISRGYENRRQGGEKFNQPFFNLPPQQLNTQTLGKVLPNSGLSQKFATTKDGTPNPTNQPQYINPKLMEDFVRVANKLSGTTLELQISGTLNVNINSPNLSDGIAEKLRPIFSEYVDDEIIKAVNKLIGDANLGIAPRNTTKKEGK